MLVEKLGLLAQKTSDLDENPDPELDDDNEDEDEEEDEEEEEARAKKARRITRTRTRRIEQESWPQTRLTESSKRGTAQQQAPIDRKILVRGVQFAHSHTVYPSLILISQRSC